VCITVVGRMLGQDMPSSGSGGGAINTGRVMEKLGIAIQLLSNPDELQQRIEDFLARHNATNSMPSAVCKIIRVLPYYSIPVHSLK